MTKLEKTKKDFTNVVTTALFPRLSYVFIQCAMFFLHYGLKYKMPWWVVWFPTFIYGIILVVSLILLLIIIVAAVILD